MANDQESKEFLDLPGDIRARGTWLRPSRAKTGYLDVVRIDGGERVRAAYRSCEICSGRQRNLEGHWIGIQVLDELVEVRTKKFGEVVMVRALSQALNSRGLRLQAAGAYPGLRVTGLSEGFGGYVGRRAYHALDPYDW